MKCLAANLAEDNMHGVCLDLLYYFIQSDLKKQTKTNVDSTVHEARHE